MNAAERWFQELQRTWLAKDITAVRSLLAGTFEYYENPLEEPLTTWEQVEAVWQEVKGQNISHLEIVPLITSDVAGSASYTFHYSDEKGSHESTGSYFVRLNEDGKAIEFRQWWMGK